MGQTTRKKREEGTKERKEGKKERKRKRVLYREATAAVKIICIEKRERT